MVTSQENKYIIAHSEEDSINNISFVSPTIAVLQAYYFGIKGVFTTDFPSRPPVKFNYTGDNIPKSLWAPVEATKVKVLKYNSTVQLVYQATNIFLAENHPMHLHGYNFYVVGQGFGNYNPKTDPLKFNLVDPPERNTVIAPVSGWVAIRFKADNPGMHQFIMHIIPALPFNSTIPNLWHIAAYKYNKVNIVVLWTGVWFLHCHLDDHLTWGLNTVFLVKNGPSLSASLKAPPRDLPKC